MLMQVSDFISNFLAKKKIKYVYAVTGGASLHLIHSAQKNNEEDQHKKCFEKYPTLNP